MRGDADPRRVVVCDDAIANRQCMVWALESHGIDADVAWDLPSLLASLSENATHVLLVNSATPDATALIQMALAVTPDTRVIVTGLSADREPEIVSFAEAGVTGLHLRTESFEELLALIRADGDGQVCSPAVSAILVRHVYGLVEQENSTAQDAVLTERESQILRMLEEGLSNQQIATRLCVSVHTVKSHVHSLFGKIGAGSRAEAVKIYRTLGGSTIGADGSH